MTFNKYQYQEDRLIEVARMAIDAAKTITAALEDIDRSLQRSAEYETLFADEFSPGVRGRGRRR